MSEVENPIQPQTTSYDPPSSQEISPVEVVNEPRKKTPSQQVIEEYGIKLAVPEEELAALEKKAEDMKDKFSELNALTPQRLLYIAALASGKTEAQANKLAGYKTINSKLDSEWGKLAHRQMSEAFRAKGATMEKLGEKISKLLDKMETKWNPAEHFHEETGQVDTAAINVAGKFIMKAHELGVGEENAGKEGVKKEVIFRWS